MSLNQIFGSLNQKKSVCDLKLYVNTVVGKILLVIGKVSLRFE